MITVIHEAGEGREIKRIAEIAPCDAFNLTEAEYPKLSEIDGVSWACFAAVDMSELIQELSKVKLVRDASMAVAIEEIINLARHCQSMPGSTLTFTPFEMPDDAE